MHYTEIDLETYPRKAHFELFSSLADPTVGLTARVDVTDAVRFCRQKGCSFYTVFIHIAALAANEVPELRRRVRNGGIIEYDLCATSHVELTPSGAYGYCTLRHDMGWDEYLRYAAEERRKALLEPTICEDEDVDSYFFVTTVPWLSYDQVTMPYSGASNPNICWGKFEPDAQGRLMMPLTLNANHALADGKHIADFFENIRRQLAALKEVSSC